MPGLVLVGVDGSEASIEALRWAHHQALLMGARLEVVTTWEPVPAPYGWGVVAIAGVPDLDGGGDAQRIADEAIVAALGESAGAGVIRRIEEGHPAPVLVGMSNEADLLVVGSSGHGAFVGMVLGSVSAHCAHHAGCPVVIVRSPTTAD